MAIIGFMFSAGLALYFGGAAAIAWIVGGAWDGVQNWQWRREHAKLVSHYRTFMRRCEL